MCCSPRWESSLTSRIVAAQRQLRCVIAAGGTAGHVLSALAVAEALTARGVFVTFAGSPDRAEAQLVPDAGYELDTFRVSGFPRDRRPRSRARSCRRRARRAPAARSCAGAGRTSSSAAAATSPGRWCSPRRRCGSRPRSPRPTRTSGSRTGSRAVREARLPRLSARRPRRRASTASSAGRSRRARGRCRRPRRARSSSCRRTGPCCSSPVRSPARSSLNELAVEAFGEVGPAILHISGERDYDSLRARVRRPDYRLIPETDRIGAAYSAADLVLAPRGELGLGDRRRRPPGDPRPVPVRDRRPPGEERGALRRARAGRSWCASSTSTTCPSSSARCSTIRRGSSGWATRCCAAARPDAADEIAEELIALAAA